MKTLAVIDSLLHAYQLVVLLFEGPLLCRVSEEQGEIFTLLTEILVGSSSDRFDSIAKINFSH